MLLKIWVINVLARMRKAKKEAYDIAFTGPGCYYDINFPA
jgi:hypothetical protein